MAEAGLYYYPELDTPKSDKVQCYQCGLSLDGWEPLDDPR